MPIQINIGMKEQYNLEIQLSKLQYYKNGKISVLHQLYGDLKYRIPLYLKKHLTRESQLVGYFKYLFKLFYMANILFPLTKSDKLTEIQISFTV